MAVVGEGLDGTHPKEVWINYVLVVDSLSSEGAEAARTKMKNDAVGVGEEAQVTRPRASETGAKDQPPTYSKRL